MKKDSMPSADNFSENSSDSEVNDKTESQPTDENSYHSEEAEKESSFSAEVEEKAEKILSAVSRILDSNDKIRSVCKKYKRQALLNTDDDDDDDDDEKSIYMEAGKRIITHYSDRASISGGLASLPSMIPGFGTAVSILGASAADVVLMLKFEFEMALCLCHLTGFDIEEERNRQLAFALAIASSRDILTNKNEPVQSKAIVKSAFWDYSVRQLSKHVIKNIAAILYMNLTKGMVKALPFVGVAVGASFNKVMTKRTGLCCLDALWLRRHIAISSRQDDEEDTVYDAEILD